MEDPAVVRKILDYLDYSEVVALCSVSSHFQQICNDEFWAQKYSQDFNDSYFCQSIILGNSWEEQYRLRYFALPIYFRFESGTYLSSKLDNVGAGIREISYSPVHQIYLILRINHSVELLANETMIPIPPNYYGNQQIIQVFDDSLLSSSGQVYKFPENFEPETHLELVLVDIPDKIIKIDRQYYQTETGKFIDRNSLQPLPGIYPEAVKIQVQGHKAAIINRNYQVFYLTFPELVPEGRIDWSEYDSDIDYYAYQEEYGEESYPGEFTRMYLEEYFDTHQIPGEEFDETQTKLVDPNNVCDLIWWNSSVIQILTDGQLIQRLMPLVLLKEPDQEQAEKPVVQINIQEPVVQLFKSRESLIICDIYGQLFQIKSKFGNFSKPKPIDINQYFWLSQTDYEDEFWGLISP